MPKRKPEDRSARQWPTPHAYEDGKLLNLEDPLGYLHKAAEFILKDQWIELRKGGQGSVLLDALHIASDWQRGEDPERREAARKATAEFARAVVSTKRRGRRRRVREDPLAKLLNTELEKGILCVATAEKQARKEGRPMKQRTLQLVREAIRKGTPGWADPKALPDRVNKMIEEMAQGMVTSWASFSPKLISGHEDQFEKIGAIRTAAAKGRRALRRELGFDSDRSKRRRKLTTHRRRKMSAKSSLS